MARLKDIVVDSPRPAVIAQFWAAVLDDYAVAPYGDAEIERLRALGITDLDDDPGVMVESSEGGPRLYFQQVPEPKVAKNRMHLDVSTADRSAEVSRLVGLGASVVAVREGWTSMLDPDGNEFCVADL